MSSKFIKMINNIYYIEDCDEYINIDNYGSYKCLKNSIEDYLKYNKIKVASIYKNYSGFGFDFIDLVFIILVLNGYKFKNNLFIAHMVCKILYRFKKDENDNELCNYLLDLIKNNNNIKYYFEKELIITDKELEMISIDNDYDYILFPFQKIYYLLSNTELSINKPKIIFNLDKHKKLYDINISYLIAQIKL